MHLIVTLEIFLVTCSDEGVSNRRSSNNDDMESDDLSNSLRVLNERSTNLMLEKAGVRSDKRVVLRFLLRSLLVSILDSNLTVSLKEHTGY